MNTNKDDKWGLFFIMLIVDFLLTGFGLWLILKLLGVCGISIMFTWGRVFVVWLILKIAKIFL